MSIARRRAQRDDYWSNLLFNMADGNHADIEVLNGLEVGEFYQRLTIWDEKIQREMAALNVNSPGRKGNRRTSVF